MKRPSPVQLADLLRSSGASKFSRRLPLSWSSIVGGALESATQFEKLQGNTVYVRSQSPAATAELKKIETQVLRLVFGERYGESRMVVRQGLVEEKDLPNVPQRVRHRRGQKHGNSDGVREACAVITDEELRGSLETFLSWEAPGSE